MEEGQTQPMYDGFEGIPDNYSTPPLNFAGTQKTGSSLVKELNPQQTLRDIMEELKGKIWDDRQNKYIDVEGISPLMNAEGRDIFFHFANASINNIVTMSNYTKDYTKIHDIVLMQVKKASIHFHLHWEDYGITRKTKINIITDKLMILTLSCFYKALGAGDRAAATRNISESINTLSRLGGDEHQRAAPQRGIFGRVIAR